MGQMFTYECIYVLSTSNPAENSPLFCMADLLIYWFLFIKQVNVQIVLT